MTQMFSALNSCRMVAEVARAGRRVAYAAPGIDNAVAAAMVDASRRINPGAVTIVLDCDEKVCRLGYGGVQGVRWLKDAGLDVRQSPGLRVGVLVCDDSAWCFAPTALYVEEQPHSDETPNAVRLVPEQAAALIQAICPSSLPGTAADAGREIGVEPLSPPELAKVEEGLAIAPPLAFDVSRQVRVFHPYIQYVDLSLKGCSINRHVVQLPGDIVHLVPSDEVNARLKTTFNLIGRSSNLSDSALQAALKQIRKKYVRSLGQLWGNVLLRARRLDFDKEVEAFRAKVEAHQKKVQAELQAEIDKSIGQIAKAFAARVRAKPPPDLLGGTLGEKPTREDAIRWLHAVLSRVFPLAEEIVSRMELIVHFKDVTYETLNEEGFGEALRTAFPAVNWGKPFSEFDAARAREDQQHPKQ
ncbi:MAG: hypothetical protein IMZ69_12310 [Spirochaetes bacterium]|nr:hypothetical protein [Spirochaetota bacterium]